MSKIFTCLYLSGFDSICQNLSIIVFICHFLTFIVTFCRNLPFCLDCRKSPGHLLPVVLDPRNRSVEVVWHRERERERERGERDGPV